MIRFGNYYKRHRNGLILSFFLIVSLVSMIISSNKVVMNPEKIMYSILSVPHSLFYNTGSFFSNTINSINELKNLRKEYEKLNKMQSNYKIIERDLLSLKFENEELRKQLGFSKSMEFQSIPAEVVGKDPSNMFSAIVINKGYKHGIKKSMAVVAYQNGFQGLVGKINKVGPYTSVLLPLFNRSLFVASKMENTKYQGLINGLGNSEKIQMVYVKKRARAEIKYSDIVVTSGLSSVYPADLYIGRVRAITGKDYESSLKLFVEPIVDFSKLEYVTVLGEYINE